MHVPQLVFVIHVQATVMIPWLFLLGQLRDYRESLQYDACEFLVHVLDRLHDDTTHDWLVLKKNK